MSELITQPASRLAQLLAEGQVSSAEVTGAFIEQIQRTEPDVKAFLHCDFAASLAAAAAVDAKRRGGEAVSPLAGVPVAVKDMLLTKDMPTTAASKILQGWIPPYDATAVARLRAADMVILGKTNQDEFAMGSSNEHSAYQVTCNPRDLQRTAGGSGGGSAAAVAAHQAPLALGTDTGGSIRQPAHCTGTVGVKPTYGSVSRYGVIAMASSLDQVGPCANTVLDAALLHQVIGGYDPADSTSIPDALADLPAAARRGAADGVKGVKIGFTSLGEGYDPAVAALYERLLKRLEAEGAILQEVKTPSFEYAVAAYYLIMPAEASSNLSRYDAMRFGLRCEGSSVEQTMAKTRAAGFGSEVKRRIILGTYALSSGYYDAYYLSAQKVRTLVKEDFARAFAAVDVLLTPTAPTPAFRLGEKLDNPLAMYENDVATIPANLAGIPAGSIPMGLADGLPVGAQVMAPAKCDDRVYAVLAGIEALIGDNRNLAGMNV